MDESELEAQNAEILRKINTAEGAFRATGYFMGVLSFLVLGIAYYAFDMVKENRKDITSNERSIAIIQSREKDHELWRRRIDKRLEQVVYK